MQEQGHGPDESLQPSESLIPGLIGPVCSCRSAVGIRYGHVAIWLAIGDKGMVECVLCGDIALVLPVARLNLAAVDAVVTHAAAKLHAA